MTLSCKATPPYGPALFYKDGYHLQTSQTGHMNLYRVTKADEGVYKCEISGREESPPSRLLVRGLVTVLEPVGRCCKNVLC